MVRIPTIEVSYVDLFHRHLGSGILTGPAIREGLRVGAIECSPLDPEQVSSCSLDVHLHPRVLVHERDRPRPAVVAAIARPEPEPEDVSVPPEVFGFDIGPEGFVFQPGVLYLGATIERLHAPNLAMILAGKSSLARRGITIHSAGFIEPGWSGQVTLEITVAMPIRLFAGWPIGQVTFETLAGETEDYKLRGHYQGALASGPVPSQSHKHKPRHVGVKP